MGLFKKKSDEQLIAEAKEKISTDHSVIIDIPVGKHGADEVVAGAMIGETGKLIAMSKYGKTKWEKVYLQVFDEGLRINYIDFQCPYDQLINIEEIKTGWLDTEAIMHTKFGDLGFKIYKIDYSAFIELIGELKESYLQKVEANEKQLEIEKQQEDRKSVV